MTEQQITAEEVRRIAALARLGLTDAEVEQAVRDLRGVLAHFSKIQGIDTTDVPMASDMSGRTNVAREDAAAPESLAMHEELLDRVPEMNDGLVKVKSVFD